MSRRFGLILCLSIFGLLAGLAAGASGDDAAANGDASATAEAPAADAGRAPVMSGTTITWNRTTRRYEPPTPEQQAAIAEAMKQLLADKTAAIPLPLAKEAEVEVLPNGMKRLRATAEMLNFSLVRVGPDGELVTTCVDGAEAAGEALAVAPNSEGEGR